MSARRSPEKRPCRLRGASSGACLASRHGRSPSASEGSTGALRRTARRADRRRWRPASPAVRSHRCSSVTCLRAGSLLPPRSLTSVRRDSPLNPNGLWVSDLRRARPVPGWATGPDAGHRRVRPARAWATDPGERPPSAAVAGAAALVTPASKAICAGAGHGPGRRPPSAFTPASSATCAGAGHGPGRRPPSAAVAGAASLLTPASSAAAAGTGHGPGCKPPSAPLAGVAEPVTPPSVATRAGAGQLPGRSGVPPSAALSAAAASSSFAKRASSGVEVPAAKRVATGFQPSGDWNQSSDSWARRARASAAALSCVAERRKSSVSMRQRTPSASDGGSPSARDMICTKRARASASDRPWVSSRTSTTPAARRTMKRRFAVHASMTARCVAPVTPTDSSHAGVATSPEKSSASTCASAGSPRRSVARCPVCASDSASAAPSSERSAAWSRRPPTGRKLTRTSDDDGATVSGSGCFFAPPARSSVSPGRPYTPSAPSSVTARDASLSFGNAASTLAGMRNSRGSSARVRLVSGSRTSAADCRSSAARHASSVDASTASAACASSSRSSSRVSAASSSVDGLSSAVTASAAFASRRASAASSRSAASSDAFHSALRFTALFSTSSSRGSSGQSTSLPSRVKVSPASRLATASFSAASARDKSSPASQCSRCAARRETSAGSPSRALRSVARVLFDSSAAWPSVAFASSSGAPVVQCRHSASSCARSTAPTSASMASTFATRGSTPASTGPCSTWVGTAFGQPAKSAAHSTAARTERRTAMSVQKAV